MKPIGKTMKIAKYNNTCEKKALSQLLSNYRDTPHPATGVPPAELFFRDPPNSTFPRMDTNESKINEAHNKDKSIKQERQNVINNIYLGGKV